MSPLVVASNFGQVINFSDGDLTGQYYWEGGCGSEAVTVDCPGVASP